MKRKLKGILVGVVLILILQLLLYIYPLLIREQLPIFFLLFMGPFSFFLGGLIAVKIASTASMKDTALCGLSVGFLSVLIPVQNLFFLINDSESFISAFKGTDTFTVILGFTAAIINGSIYSLSGSSLHYIVETRKRKELTYTTVLFFMLLLTFAIALPFLLLFHLDLLIAAGYFIIFTALFLLVYKEKVRTKNAY